MEALAQTEAHRAAKKVAQEVASQYVKTIDELEAQVRYYEAMYADEEALNTDTSRDGYSASEGEEEDDDHEADSEEGETSEEEETPAIQKGSLVRLCDLTEVPKLNGKFGIVVGYDEGKARWMVRINESGEVKLMRGGSLRCYGGPVPFP